MDSPKPKTFISASTGKELFGGASNTKIPFQNSTNKDYSAIRKQITPCGEDATSVKLSHIPTKAGKVSISYTTTH